MLNSALSSKSYNKVQTKNMKAYFKQIHFLNQMLRDEEAKILYFNLSIIKELLPLARLHKTFEISLEKQERDKITSISSI